MLHGEAYDGFYSICANLEDDVSKILSTNKGRWDIGENLGIMRSEFKS